VEGGLPLDYNGPEHRLASEFWDNYGPAYENASKNVERLADVDNNTLVAAPKLDSTSKWVDMALQRSLYDAIKGDVPVMTTPRGLRGIAKVGGGSTPTDGSVEFYHKIVPSRLQKIARGYDKNAKLEPMRINTGEGPEDVFGLRLTPEFINGVAKKGIPSFAFAGGVPLFSYGNEGPR
jgi:hypothetical protein